MNILGIDTTGPYCSAAIVDEACILAHQSENIGRGHAERLAPMVDDILGKAKLTPNQIDKISVCTGPGSFTGIRVALAFAKGFALPRNIPVIGINALDVTAQLVSTDYQDRRVGVYRDIRRDEIYFGVYRNGHLSEPLEVMSLDMAEAKTYRLQTGLIESHIPNTPILAWLAAERSSLDHPAAPFYSRPPDAKLPEAKLPDTNRSGGKNPA